MEKNGLSCLGLCIEKCYGILGYMFFFMKTSSVNREAQNKHFSESCPGNHIWVCKYYVHIYRSLSTGIGEREIHWDQTTAFWGTTPCRVENKRKLFFMTFKIPTYSDLFRPYSNHFRHIQLVGIGRKRSGALKWGRNL